MRFPERPPRYAGSSIEIDYAKLYPHVSPVLPDGRYMHWNDLRWRSAPSGLTQAEWWLAQKIGRRGSRVQVRGLTDQEGQPFWFCRLDAIDRATHELDRRDATREMLDALGDDGARQAYRIDQLIEEAISSSVLEGAKLTTRAEAKEIIRDGRPPGNHGERMVVNNYNAMRRLLEIVKRDLTLEDLLEIHAVLGEDSLDAPGAAGRLRNLHDSVRVEDAMTGEVWFTPPPAAELPMLLGRMLTFANEVDPDQFLHPLLRAIILHFWLAYLHPFVDGNGCMARALFYWQMLRSGYDFAQYLSISGPIDRSRRAYYMAFAYTETDEGDLTYFLLHQLSVLRRATAELLQHLRERSARMRELASAVKGAEALNHRQQAALLFSIRNPHLGLTVNGHMTSHGISYLTARKDLQDLEAAGYLKRLRVGRTDRYLPREKLAALEKAELVQDE
jgi:Fic family protein